MNIYEPLSTETFTCHAIRPVTGDTIRPGGLKVTKRAVDFCQLPPGCRLLDVGCGTGASVEFLINQYNIDAFGIDPSDAILKLGRNLNARLPIFHGKAEDIPFPDHSMDALLTECCLSHLTDIDMALREFYRVILPEGWLIISDMYLKRKPYFVEEVDGHSSNSFMDRDVIMNCLASHGFEVVLWEDQTHELKQLTINIIMRYGTLAKFWEETGCNCTNCFAANREDYKLGYYLLIAKKK